MNKLDKKNKKILYDSYIRIVDSPKKYKNVTIENIRNEVIQYYMDYNNILNICSFSEIVLLNSIVTNKIDNDGIIKDKNYDDLRSKMLLSVDTNNNVIIPPELEKSISLAYKNMNREGMERVETLDVLLIGLFRIYGMLTIDSLYNILVNYIVIEKEDLKKHIVIDKYLNFYLENINYKRKDYLVYRSYVDLVDILYTGIDSFHELDYFLRPFEEIIYLRFNYFNDMNKDIMKFHEELIKRNVDMDIIHEIVIDTVLDGDRKELIKKFDEYGDEFISMLNNAMDNMPSACLKGYTRKEYLDTLSNKKYEEDYDNVRYDNEIVKYKEIREKTKVVMDEAMYYAFKEKITDKFSDVISSNNIYFTETDTAVVTNLVLFHQIDNEKSSFDIFYDKKVNIFFPYYDLFKEFKDSYVEGLFIITKANKEEGYVILKSEFSNRDYKVYDVALSCNKNILNNYIYTAIVTIDGFTFTTDYILILGIDVNIPKIIADKGKSYKGIKSNTTKEFLASYEMFRDGSLNIKPRNLD